MNFVSRFETGAGIATLRAFSSGFRRFTIGLGHFIVGCGYSIMKNVVIVGFNQNSGYVVSY